MSKRGIGAKVIANVTPEFIRASHAPAVRALAERLRTIVRQTIPEATEAAYPVWHGIGYRHPESGYFCAIFPQNEGVKLGFEWGVRLPDLDGLLEGTGKQVRYVVMKEEKDVQEEPIKRLLLAAIELGGR